MAQTVVESFLENPLFRLYAFYGSLLMFKMMFMTVLTACTRVKNKAYITSEDAVYLKGKVRVEESVERIRRAHLNDLENIPIFLFISFIYVLTNPTIFLATTLFRIYTIARFAHTFVYAIVVFPQPARGLIFVAAFVVTAYMVVQNLLYFLQ